MTTQSVFRWNRALLVALFTLALGGCNGGGGSGDGQDSGEADGGGNDGGESDDMSVRLATRIEGEVVPGQTIRLVASEDTGGALAYRWEQTDGPPVALERARSASAQFRVPAVGRDTALAFRLVVTGADGREHRRSVHLLVESLSWKDLHVVETELTENFVVFRANKDNSLRVDLYRADLDGSNIMRLNGPLAPGGNVHSFAISPNGEYVAYLADENSSGVLELFGVYTAGGESVGFSGDLVAGGDVTPDFLWSPDSSRIAYRADQNTDEVFELFAAYSDLRPPVRLSGEMTPNGDVVAANFFWRGDSGAIAYRANQFNDNTLELFVSGRDGAANRRVSAPPVPGGGALGNFAWMPGGERIAYVADLTAVDAFELFVVNGDGTGNAKVSGPLVTDGSVLDFAWAPGGDYLAYRAEQLSDGVVELYGVRPDGSDNTLISALPATGDVGDYAWAPDGSAIAYLADQDVDERVELFAAGPDGAANRKLSGPLIAAGDVFDFAWSPDGTYLAYRADQIADQVEELFTATPDGAVNLKVSGVLAIGGEVLGDWRWSGDSRWIAYRADQRSNGVLELFSSAPDGSANVLISGSLVAGGGVASLDGRAFEWSPDSTRIVYSADQQVDGKHELYVTSPDSGIAIASISGTLTAGGDVRNFALASRPGSLARMHGVQTDVPRDALLGWEECWRDTYNTFGAERVSDILATCDREHLLLACRPVGSATFTVAAWGPRGAVTADAGTGNVTTNANGVEWYFNDNYSWGFAAGGDAVIRGSCDVQSTNPDLRLCWHTGSGGFINGGYRCGVRTSLNNNANWERLLFHRTP